MIKSRLGLLVTVAFLLILGAGLRVHGDAVVTQSTDNGTGQPGTLSAAIAAGGNITFANGITTITLTGNLPLITQNTTINSGGTTVTINGGGTFRAFMVTGGTVSLNDLLIENTKAQGGAGGSSRLGGGGGLGAGGGLFVGAGAAVTLNTVNFTSTQAIGGAGGGVNNGNDTGAGGGGLNGGRGGNSTSIEGGTGGGSITGNGGDNSGFEQGTAGGPNGGGNGGNFNGGSGGNGTFGGGGGGGAPASVGVGVGGSGGAGGFGGGGGGAGAGFPTGTGGLGGFGAGNGASTNSTPGGAGSGFGGAVFVETGGSLTVNGNGTLSGNSVSSPGAQAAGSDFYFMAGTTGTLAPGTGNTITSSGTIADNGGAGAALVIGSAGNSGGTVVLAGVNTYTGGTTVDNGTTLQLGAGGSTQGTLGSGTVTDNTSVVFNEGVATTIANTINGSGTLTQEGTGALRLNGANGYTGGTTLQTGTLILGSSGALGTGTLTTIDPTVVYTNGITTPNPIVMMGDTTLEVDNTDSATQSGVISESGGSFAVTKTGTGTLTLSATNTYTGGTTISAGTLGADNSSALGTGDVTVSSGASLQVGGAPTLLNNITISGTGVGGAGAIFANDGLQNEINGTMTLAGDATVNTTLGRLLFNGTIDLGANNLTLGGTGALDVLGNVTGTTGGITVTGSAVTISSPISNTYTGLTTVDAGGVLRLGDFNGAIAIPGNLSVSGSVVNLNSGQFAATSVVTLSGNGQFNFEGTNLSETIAGLNGTSGTRVAPITGSMGGVDTVTISGPGSYSYAGQINDLTSPPFTTGVALSMTGTGTQTLSGANNYSGGTTQSAGTLIIGNGTALGTGAVTQSGGTLETDNVNHVIAMQSGFDQTGGTLLLNFNGAPGAASNDQVHVTGTAALGGHLVINYTAGALAPLQSETYSAITTTGGITSVNAAGYEPPALQAGALQILITGAVNGSDFDVTLTGRQTGFTPLAGANYTPNQLSVASYLDRFDGTVNSGPVLALLSALDAVSVNAASVGPAFDQLTPLNFGRFASSTAFNGASFQVQQFDNYLASHRGADGKFFSSNGGLDSSGLVVNDPNIDPGLQMVHSRLLAWNPAPGNGILSDAGEPLLAGVDMKDPKEMVSSQPEPTNSWDVFVTGNVVLAQDFSDSSTGLSHANSTTGGVQIGADYRISSHFLAGVTFGYGHTDATLDTLNSEATVDTYSPGVYASYSNGGWYANALGSYGFANYTQDRNVSIGTFDGTAHSSPSGDQIVGDLDGGYDFHRGAWTFGPTLGVQYVHLDVNGYTETGLPGANLVVNDDQGDSLRSRLGGRLSFAFSHCGINFTPHLDASWQHEFLDQSRGITSQFDGIGAGSFVVQTENPSRDSALVDVGMDAEINHSVTTFLDYQVQAGQENYFGQSVQAGVKIGF